MRCRVAYLLNYISKRPFDKFFFSNNAQRKWWQFTFHYEDFFYPNVYMTLKFTFLFTKISIHSMNFIDIIVCKILLNPIDWLMLIYVNGQKCNASQSIFDSMMPYYLDQFQLNHIVLPPFPHWHRSQVIVYRPNFECVEHLLFDFPPEKKVKRDKRKKSELVWHT